MRSQAQLGNEEEREEETLSGPMRESWLDGFRGEYLTVAEHRLGPLTSPDARNVDYRDGLLRPRAGLVRLHGTAALGGGLKVSDGTTTPGGSGRVDIGYNTAYNFTGDFCYEFLASVHFPAVTSDYKNLVVASNGYNGVTGTAGVLIGIKKVSGTPDTYRWYARVFDLTTGHVEITASTDIVAGQVYHIRVQLEHTAGLPYLGVDGTNYTNGVFATPTFLRYAGGFYLGEPYAAYTLDQDIYFIIDELRIWNTFTPAQDLTASRRELLASEMTGLVGYWKFNAGSWTAVGNLREYPDYSATNNKALAYPRATEARGFVTGTSNRTTIRGLFPIAGDTTTAQVLVCTTSDVFTLDFATGALSLVLPASAPAAGRWHSCAFERTTVLVNGAAENLAYTAALGARRLSLQYPDLTTPPVGTPGAGGSLSSGTYKYRFTWLDSARNVESWTGTGIVTVAGVSASDKVDFTGLPETAEAGVDTLRIWRTAAGGADYYLAGTVAANTATYSDTLSDAALADAEALNEFRGYAPPAKVCWTMHGRVFLAGFSEANGGASRVIFSEAGGYSDFYDDNELFIGDSDNDGIQGAYVGSDLAIVWKRRSMWAVVADGTGYRAVPLQRGYGLCEQATVASGDGFVYWAGPGGVYRMATGETAPQLVGGEAMRPVFESLEQSHWAECCAAYDEVTHRLYVGLGSEDGRATTLVWDAVAEAWSRWDLDVGALLAIYPLGGAYQVLAGWRGNVCRLTAEKRDGVDLATAATANPSGTATGGGAGYLEKTGAGWPTTGTGLAGASVTLTRAADGSEETQEIWGNTATRLLVPGWTGAAPVNGDSYEIGRIAWRWRSPLRALDGLFEQEKVFKRAAVVHETAGVGSYTLEVLDAGLATVYSAAIDATLRTEERTVERRLREVSVRLSGKAVTGSPAVAALLLPWEGRAARG